MIRPKQKNIGAQNLLLDLENPRLPEGVTKDREKLWRHMKQAYDLDEIALSIAHNGYFLTEPLVVIPKDSQYSINNDYEGPKYIVVEGNRRLASIQGLLSGKFNQVLESELNDEVRKQLENDIPVLVYPSRRDVLAFLGVKHLAGVRKWNFYERARYISKLLNENYTMNEIQNIIGDRKNSARKTYTCYKLIQIVEDYDDSFDTTQAKRYFSFLLLATGQAPIREYIGLPTWKDVDIHDPIPKDKRGNLRFLFECLYDNGHNKSLIRESRDITQKLSKILDNEEAVKSLEQSRNLDDSYDLTDGEVEMLLNSAVLARRKLESFNGKISSMDINGQVINNSEGIDLKGAVVAIYNIVIDILNKFK